MTSIDNQPLLSAISDHEGQKSNNLKTAMPPRKASGSPQKSDKFHNSASAGWDRFWAFASSGLFFMLFGSVMLFFAYNTMTRTHSSFTFIIVVVGVAILLYGTGTQGAGEFAGENGGARYKAAIAGGAGVLALAIGIGMVVYYNEIRAAFQIEQKYVRVPLYPDNFADDFTNYAAIATVNGINVPTVLRGEVIEIYVPYLAGQEKGAVMHISCFLYRLQPNSKQKQSVKFSKDLTFSSGNLIIEGGFEFPRLEINEKTKISVRESESIDLATLDKSATLDKNESSESSLPPPPALVTEAQ